MQRRTADAPFRWGYVRATDLFAEGTQVTVRTLQGDMKATVEAGIAFIIGPKGECFFRNEEALWKNSGFTRIGSLI